MSDSDPVTTVQRLVASTNAHDLDAIVACFAEDYTLESPLHPARSFRGTEQVRKNWSQILGSVPDVRAKLVGSARDDDTAWTEWEMTGTRRDGKAFLMRGIFVFTVAQGRIRAGRMFLEPVEEGGGDMNAAVHAATQGRPA